MKVMQVLRGYDEAEKVFAGRSGSVDETKWRAVAEILKDVRERGDEALYAYTARFDGVQLSGLRVPEADFSWAQGVVAPEVREAIALAAARIRRFYSHQPKEGFLQPDGDGLLGQLVRPLKRVAVYVPAGSATLFSTLLMCAVPAQVAGVKEIVVAVPPRKDGRVAPEVLLAAQTLGISEVYRVGGAQAVAALAYGTKSVPRVDKIVGPGNDYVVLAKQMVFGAVGIESLPGPTETLVLADETAAIGHVVADLLAQAEHVYAQPVLVTPSQRVLDEVEAEIKRQLEGLSTRAFAEASLQERGYAVLVRDLEEGMRVANLYASEHLCLLLKDPWAWVPKVENAGGIFVGEASMEALGDYAAGPSHVMPTGGTARFSSAVNVRDFQKVIPLVNVSHKTLEAIGPAAAVMARAEGLEAHARAIESRLHAAKTKLPA